MMGLGVVLLILLASSALTTLVSSSSASAASITTAAAASPKTVFYLDIGASVSVGVQPTSKFPGGQPTHRGYANRLVTYEAARGVTLQLTQLGCPGESTTTMMLGGDKCYKAPDNQLADAVAFLSAHRDQTGLVTLDLGFNDIAPCLRSMTVDKACVSQNLVLLQRQLPEVIASLKAVAGPNVTFIGLNHYNPYLAAALDGSKGTQFASDSIAVLLQLNNVLQQVYSASDIPLANVVASFVQNAPRTAKLVKGRPVPTSAIQACSLTWMCRQGPYGANIHPNNAGYEAITDAITVLLPKW
jgi:lysophospholipase L1-like esterase